MGSLILVLGGARSGKSAYAEGRAREGGVPVLYVATAEALDQEMRARIAEHRRRRAVQWETLEIPSDVGPQVLAQHPAQPLIILDCITLLISNLLLQAAPDMDHPDPDAARRLVESEIGSLIEAVDQLEAEWLVVSNEAGQGVVPPYPSGRLFRDLLGWANQRLARHAAEVIWMVAGIPVPIGQYR
jgi:adenosylcobinamide kinase/adenosylcobinamide-phosphate guanylyltransferase